MNREIDTVPALSADELALLGTVAGTMIPASAEYGMPGADDDAIMADIVRSLGRDLADVRLALDTLRSMGAGRFAALDQDAREAVMARFQNAGGPAVVALSRAVLQCYYRDDRVLIALGLEPRPPFPKGHVLEQGDWSLLDAVRGRGRMWRDVDQRG